MPTHKQDPKEKIKLLGWITFTILMEVNFLDVSFSYRITLLIIILILLSIFDYYSHPQSKYPRWKEFSFLVFVGIIGAIVGLLNDLLTSHISPEYFIIGKGIENNSEWQKNALKLGAQAGFIAGIWSACIALYFNNPKPNKISLSYLKLFSVLLKLLFIIFFIAGVFGILIFVHPPVNMLSDYQSILPLPQLKNFAMVWGMHNGLYFGLFVGIIWAVFCIRKKRQQMSFR